MSVGRLRTRCAKLPVFQDDLTRQAAVGAHNAASRVRGRPAHREVVNRRTVIGPPGNGPQEEEMFEGKLALKNVSLREAEFAFHVERCEHLLADDDRSEERRVGKEGRWRWWR